MEKEFHINILAPDKKVFEGEIVSLIVPATLGYLGVLANHAPLITSLVPGKIIYRSNHGSQVVIRNNGKGFMEVAQNSASLLLEEAG